MQVHYFVILPMSAYSVNENYCKNSKAALHAKWSMLLRFVKLCETHTGSLCNLHSLYQIIIAFIKGVMFLLPAATRHALRIDRLQQTTVVQLLMKSSL